MEIQPDGSILIRGSLDGPFTPVNKVSKLIQDFYPKKIRSIETSSPANPTLFEHQLEHGRPATHRDEVRQATIKRLIQQLQSKTPGLTFQKAWDKLQQTHPDLFKTDF